MDNIEDLKLEEAKNTAKLFLKNIKTFWNSSKRSYIAKENFGNCAFDVLNHYFILNRARLITQDRKFKITGNKISRKEIFIKLSDLYSETLFNQFYQDAIDHYAETQKNTNTEINAKYLTVSTRNGKQDDLHSKTKAADIHKAILNSSVQSLFGVIFGLTEVVAYSLTSFDFDVDSHSVENLKGLRADLRLDKDHLRKLKTIKSKNKLQNKILILKKKIEILERKIDKKAIMRRNAFKGYVRESLANFVTEPIITSKRKFKTKKNLHMKQLIFESIKLFSELNFKVFNSYDEEILQILESIERDERSL